MRFFYPFVALMFYVLGWLGGSSNFAYDWLVVVLLSAALLVLLVVRWRDIEVLEKYWRWHKWIKEREGK